MTSIHHPKLLTLAALAAMGLLGALPAAAQSESYGYGGLALGQSRSQIDTGRISRSLIDPALTIGPIASQQIDLSWKAFGGYQFNRNVAVELGFFSLGSFGFNTSTTPAGTLQGQSKLQGLNLDLVGFLPVTEQLSALARVGAQYARTRGEYSATGAVGSFRNTPSERRTDLKLGVGLQYAFSPSFLMRGEVERYRVSDAMGQRDHVNAFTLSAVFPFGRVAESTRRVAAAPAYVAPVEVAPAPAPMPAQVTVLPAPVLVVVAPPAPPVVAPRRVSFSADSLFGFDQSALQPDSKTALDTFARELKGTQFDSIAVEGHTDRLGSSAYNDKLSLQRAEAVKRYLVTSDGLDGSRISAVGKGESMPVTKPGDCKGKQSSPTLITCLQPDRRVDVEVSGTR